jgi:hypothetical protein
MTSPTFPMAYPRNVRASHGSILHRSMATHKYATPHRAISCQLIQPA